MRRAVVLLVLIGCGGGDALPTPDAAAVDASGVDIPQYPACREFLGGVAHSVPAHVVGSLAAPDVQSPPCASVHAPYGVESAGPDSVVAVGGLVPGTAYIVQLRSTSDLAFYVATGCSTPSGPAASECTTFVDASAAGDEVGRFVATTETAFVVVDYYASHTPASQSFTLDVYAEVCTNDSGCTSGLSVCSNGRCVQCADDFDCTDPTLPRCETTNTCAAGLDTCETDDASEPEDDGPAGALPIVPDGSGAASSSGQVCSSPRSEADFFSFQVTDVGQIWALSLGWSDGDRDLDIEVYAATGDEIGLSYWERPEVIRLTHLPVGTYYVKVTEFASDATPVAYTLDVQRTQAAGCTSRADCATEHRNQLFRGECQAGACVAIAGNATISQGGACDSLSDCANGLACPSFYFVANADSRNVCTPSCGTDADCAGLGTGYVCTTYLITNMCVKKCTTDDHCPVDVDSRPVSGPWYRLRCQAATGRCVL